MNATTEILNKAEIMGGTEGKVRWANILETEGEAAFREQWTALEKVLGNAGDMFAISVRKHARQIREMEKSDCSCGGCADCIGQE